MAELITEHDRRMVTIIRYFVSSSAVRDYVSQTYEWTVSSGDNVLGPAGMWRNSNAEFRTTHNMLRIESRVCASPDAT